MIDVLRRFAPTFLRQHRVAASTRSTLGLQLRCRTPALGGHHYWCDNCGYSVDLYNSCGNRHCPQCQGARRARWTEAKQALLLPVPHFQVVFTLPAELRPIARSFPREIYDLLFQAAKEVLKKLAATHLDATLAILAVLHTWTRDLSYHPHVHCIVSAGGLDDDDGWVATDPKFLFAHAAMQRLFRGVFLSQLTRLGLPLDRNQRRLLKAARQRAAQKNWVVFVEAPNDRDPQHLVKYLARYVYQTAISDHRIVAIGETEVTIRTRGAETVTMSGVELVRRLGLHFLPKGFHRTREFCLLASGARARLRRAREITQHLAPTPPRRKPRRVAPRGPFEDEPGERRCPKCNGPLWRSILYPTLVVVPTARGPP